MKCRCASAAPLQLERDAISDRAKRSRELRRALTVVAKHHDREHQLCRCDQCGTLWQRASAWNWGAKEYFFAIPFVAERDWLAQRFVDPDELLVWAAVLDRYLRETDALPTELSCAQPGCVRKAVRHSRLCLSHHVEDLQHVRILPATPEGRFFEPYEQLKPERLDEYMATLGR